MCPNYTFRTFIEEIRSVGVWEAKMMWPQNWNVTSFDSGSQAKTTQAIFFYHKNDMIWPNAEAGKKNDAQKCNSGL